MVLISFNEMPQKVQKFLISHKDSGMEVNRRKLIVFLTHQNSGQNRNPNISNNFINKVTFKYSYNKSQRDALFLKFI